MDLASVAAAVWRLVTTTVGFVTPLSVAGVVIGGTVFAVVRKRIVGNGLDGLGRRLFQRRWVPDALATALMDGEPVDVTDHGFAWLQPEQFTDDSNVDREACWRREFNFAEIHRGFAADRVPRDGETGSLTTTLVETLRGGNARVVLGAPGAGKSTLVRQVAERWEMGEHADDETGVGSDRVGRVLYRDRGSGAPITDTDAVARAIRNTPEPVLVIVSDATRPPHLPVFTLLDEFADDENVSFLLDSRETEWRDGLSERARALATDDTDADVIAPDSERWNEIVATKNDLDTIQVSGSVESSDGLTETETERVIDSFEQATEQSVGMDPATVHEQITDDNQASAMLLLSYFLPVGPVEMDRSDPEFSLSGHVEEVYDDVTPDGPETELSANERLRRQVAIGVNVLNAAGLAVREASLLGLVDDVKEQNELRRLLDTDLDGRVVFGQENKSFATNHELWSELFLVRLLNDSPSRRPFELCLNNLSNKKYSISRGEFLWKIFRVGCRRPKLSPLFSITNKSNIKINDKKQKLRLSNQRGTMNFARGMWEIASSEYEFVLEESESEGMRAAALGNIGSIKQIKDEYNKAKNYHRKSLEIFKEKEEKVEMAKAIAYLGQIEAKEENYENAVYYFNKSMKISNNANDSEGIANCMIQLAYIEASKEESKRNYKISKEYLIKAKEIFNDINSLSGRADCINGIAKIEKRNEEWGNAVPKFEEAASIYREIGQFRQYLSADHNVIHGLVYFGDDTEAVERARESIKQIERSDLNDLDSDRQFRENVIDDLTD